MGMSNIDIRLMDDNKLEFISQELKSYLTKYDTQCILGHLSFLMTCITNGAAQDQLGKLTSPMRQLYYLAGLLVSQESSSENEIQFSEKDWSQVTGGRVPRHARHGGTSTLDTLNQTAA